MVSFDPARFVRQVLLPEIGEVGQAQLVASTAHVGGDGLAHEVASRYAVAAGFARVEGGPIDEAILAPVELCTQGAARAVLAGSRAALAEVRRALRSGGIAVGSAAEALRAGVPSGQAEPAS